MAVFDNMNGTYSSGIAPEIRKYYDRTLIREAEGNLVYQRDLQKRPLPLNNGKTVQFRKFHPFAISLVPLKEGVTPDGQKIKVSEKHATIKPYGNYVPFTDELDKTTIDEMHKETAGLLSRQARETLDAIAGEAVNGGLNVIYANGTSRADIGSTNVLTSALVKKAVRVLEKNKAPKFADGCYHAVIDPEGKYDLTNDPLWIDVAKYQDKEKIERYEIGKIHGVKFYETTEAKVFKANEPLYGNVTNIAINGGSWDVAEQTGFVTVAVATGTSSSATDNDKAYWCRQMVGKTVRLYDASATAYINALIDQCFVDGNNFKLTLRYLDTASNWSYASGDKIYGQSAGASDIDVHSTIIYGQDYAGAVELGGNGGNIQSIMNAPGSSGAEDPLAQRGTIAWKVNGYCVTILQDAYVVRVEHAVSE